MINDQKPKDLVWVASSRRDMKGMPRAVQRAFGVALFVAQCGAMPPVAKPLKGFGGSGVLELIEDDRSGTYRAVYTVRFAGSIYVLHVFQKRSKRGIATPAQDIELVRERLKRAQDIHKERMREREP
jgi:phage-related protein